MKRFWRNMALYGLPLVALVGVALWGMAHYKCAYSASTHEVNVRLSKERLEATVAPRIVIVGGSNCGFGFESGLLKEHFQMAVVNTGTHADIGLRLQIKLYEPFLQAGDVVLLCPEYNLFDKKNFYGTGSTAQWSILYNNYPEGLEARCGYQKVATIRFIPLYFVNAWRTRRQQMPVENPYSAAQLNEYGDVAAVRGHEDKQGEMRLSEPYAPAFDFVAQFVQQSEQRGVRVFLFPPNFSASAFDQNQSQIVQIAEQLAQRGVPYVAEPSRYRFADSLYFDTDYHMTNQGARLRTQYVIEDLERLGLTARQ